MNIVMNRGFEINTENENGKIIDRKIKLSCIYILVYNVYILHKIIINVWKRVLHTILCNKNMKALSIIHKYIYMKIICIHTVYEYKYECAYIYEHIYYEILI